MERANSRLLVVRLLVANMRDLFLFEIGVVIPTQVPQVGNESAACCRQQTVFWVELAEVYLLGTVTVLTSLSQKDT